MTSRTSKLAVLALAFPLFAAAACDPKVEPPPMVPEGTGKASSSAVQPEVAPVETSPSDTTAKPADPAPKDPRSKDSK